MNLPIKIHGGARRTLIPPFGRRTRCLPSWCLVSALLIGISGCAGLHKNCDARACAPGLERRIAGPRQMCTCEKSCLSDHECGPDQYCNTSPEVDQVPDVCMER